MLDTEALFGLNPRDRRHGETLGSLEELRKKGQRIYAPDSTLLEFQAVLRGVGRRPSTVRAAILGLRKVLELNGVEEAGTMGTGLFARQCELEEAYGLTYFDSLVAASVLSLDGELVSDDEAFERVPGVTRTPLAAGREP